MRRDEEKQEKSPQSIASNRCDTGKAYVIRIDESTLVDRQKEKEAIRKQRHTLLRQLKWETKGGD